MKHLILSIVVILLLAILTACAHQPPDTLAGEQACNNAGMGFFWRYRVDEQRRLKVAVVCDPWVRYTAPKIVVKEW